MFTEASTLETLVRDLLCGGITHLTAIGSGLAWQDGKLAGLGWHYLALQHLPRRTNDVYVEAWLREALIRLNAEIAARRESAPCAPRAARPLDKRDLPSQMLHTRELHDVMGQQTSR